MSETCPECNGTGFRLTTHENGVLASTPCACRRDDRGEWRARAARIPRRYEHCTFEDFYLVDEDEKEKTLETARRAAQEWVELWPAVTHGLMFVGDPGTGKTHLAVALARELIRSKGARVLFWEQRELLKALQGTFDSASDRREAEVLRPVIEAEVLILDDLGAGRTTPWARDVMHDIIAQRYNEERPMIITTNHRTGDEPEVRRSASDQRLERPLTLRDRLGDALMSRLYEMCRIIEVKGKGDYRLHMQKADIRR